MEAEHSIGGTGRWAVFTISMPEVGLAHFVARNELLSPKEGQWRLLRDLEPECVDEAGQLLYSCTLSLERRRLQQVLQQGWRMHL